MALQALRRAAGLHVRWVICEPVWLMVDVARLAEAGLVAREAGACVGLCLGGMVDEPLVTRRVRRRPELVARVAELQPEVVALVARRLAHEQRFWAVSLQPVGALVQRSPWQDAPAVAAGALLGRDDLRQVRLVVSEGVLP